MTGGRSSYVTLTHVPTHLAATVPGTGPSPAPTAGPVSPPALPKPGDFLGPALHTTAHTFAQAAVEHPVPYALFALLLIAAAVSRVRLFVYRCLPRDPVRFFPPAERELLKRQAGYRCEHHDVLGRRCVETTLLEADHVRPWSRGGRTVLNNGQMLCKRHNKLKGARIPTRWELRRLARRRAGYTPAPAPTHGYDHALGRAPGPGGSVVLSSGPLGSAASRGC